MLKKLLCKIPEYTPACKAAPELFAPSTYLIKKYGYDHARHIAIMKQLKSALKIIAIMVNRKQISKVAGDLIKHSVTIAMYSYENK